MRDELQQFLNSTYGSKDNDISIPFTMLSTPVYIRFELGGNLENGTKKRVNQVVNRITNIFEKAFQNDEDIWVLAYEYPESRTLFQYDNDYFYKQFTTQALKTFYNSKEIITTNYFTEDENGNTIPETTEVNVIVGRPNIASTNIPNILKASANREMALEPAIGQDIYFISPTTGCGLHMYDDRGCDIKAPDVEIIRHVYDSFNDWILDYDRKDIDTLFK